MLTGHTTTGYLNLLGNHYYNAGVRRSEHSFLSGIRGNQQSSGTTLGFTEYVNQLAETEAGSAKIAWDADPGIVLQIFRGPIESGHWSTVVVDRTRKSHPLAVYADSLPNLYSDTLSVIQKALEHTPIHSDSLKWIRADIPRQGAGTMDCGVYSSCFPALYVRSLEKKGLLMSGRQDSLDEGVQTVHMILPKGCDARFWGGTGRAHMMGSLKQGKLCLDDPVFNASIVWN